MFYAGSDVHSKFIVFDVLDSTAAVGSRVGHHDPKRKQGNELRSTSTPVRLVRPA